MNLIYLDFAILLILWPINGNVKESPTKITHEKIKNNYISMAIRTVGLWENMCRYIHPQSE